MNLDLSMTYLADAKKGLVGVEFGYRTFLSNAVKSEERFSDLNFVLGNSYTADDYKYRQFYISLNVLVPYQFEVKKIRVGNL